jgi:magnesium chelatase subunit I
VRLGEKVAAPRVSDLGAVLASTTGKIEVETAGEDTPEERIVERLVTKSVFATFNRHTSVERLEPALSAFEDGLVVETGELVPARDYVRAMRDVPGLREAVVALGAFDAADGAEEPALVASAVELLLEGLHLHRRLTKDRGHGGVSYRR